MRMVIKFYPCPKDRSLNPAHALVAFAFLTVCMAALPKGVLSVKLAA